MERRERLEKLDFFVLDNSIRESAVGQLRGHILEDKIRIYHEVKKCGMTSAMLVASLTEEESVDGDFCQWLLDSGEDRRGMYAFAEISGSLKDGAYDTETVPISLQMNKKYKIANTFFEVELANKDCEWRTKFTMADFCGLIKKRIKWVHENISEDGCIMVNVLDLPAAMEEAPARVTELIKFLAQLSADHHVVAFCFEDPVGESDLQELKVWTARMRETMDLHGWNSGKLLVHIHNKFGTAAAAQLECLVAGADGVWASLCEDGAIVGHASSTLTMVDLIRRGNKKVQERYNCTYLRQAAFEVSKITTGRNPNPMQPVYGEQAMDVVFPDLGTGKFSLPHVFGEQEAPQRITTLATASMIKQRLTSLFGADPQFSDNAIAQRMKKTIVDDLRKGRKEEYTSAYGIAVLFARSGGKINAEMKGIIAALEVTDRRHAAIITEVQHLWDQWDAFENSKTIEALASNSFSNVLSAEHCQCCRHQDTQVAGKVLAMIRDSDMDWTEFLIYIKWALHEYHDTVTAAEAMRIALEKGIIPSMQKEKQ